MIHLIILVILTSLMCVGLFNAMQFEWRSFAGHPKTVHDIDRGTKAILWWWKYYVLNKINYQLSKPLGNCLRCMASVYGLIPYWWYVGWDFTYLENWAIYPFFVLAVSGLNTIIDQMINE